MKYQYSLSQYARRPAITVELFGPEKSILIQNALIDSGADYCVFNLEFAKYIGIDLEKAGAGNSVGIGGLEKIKTYFVEIELKIKEFDDRIKIKAGFIDSPSVIALLGQDGFFDNYKINFERNENFFEINPATTSRGGFRT